METTSLVIEHQFDETTIEELNTLRDIRLGLAQKQLKDPVSTVDELVRRGLITSKERNACLQLLQEELEKKLSVLRARSQESDKTFYFDEIGLYSDLITK
jgi:hypothetical protein